MMGKTPKHRPQTKKYTLTNPHSGQSTYYGRGRKKDVPLETFQDRREEYWTDVADQWLKGRRKNKRKETSNHDIR